jgi:hypothetical protein
MKKNVASQVVGAQMITAADGSVFTGSVTVSVTGDAGTQATGSVGSGACTHEGNGFHTYAPAQAETNYDHVAFTFTGTGAVAATVQIYTSFPQTGDSFARLGAPAGASVSADVAAVKVDTAAVKVKTDFLPSATAGAAGGVFIAGTNAATTITTSLTTTFTGNLTGSVASVTGAVGSVTGNVGGNVTGSVGSVVGAVGSVTARVTANTDQLAGQTVTAAAGVTFPTSVASPTNITAGTITTATNVTTVNGLAAGVITATSIDADAITDAKVASDVTIASVTGSVGSVTGNVGGNVTGSVGSVTGAVGSVAAGGITAASFAANAITAAKLDPDVTTELQAGLATSSSVSTLQTSVDDLPTNAELATALAAADDAVLAQVALVKAVTDKVDTALELDGAVYRYTTNALEQAPTGGSAPTAAAIADAVWDEALAGHLGAGSAGEALDAAGTAGDPWTTLLPGAYGAGTAGKIIGDNINATISSRATQTSVDDVPTNAELATALGTADDAVLTAIDALPTNAELATALGTADDAVLAAVAALTIPTTAEIADKVLGRNLAGGSDGGRMVKDALRSLRNKTSIAGGTLTVCQEDDSTAAWTAAVTTTAGDPLSSIDPA